MKKSNIGRFILFGLGCLTVGAFVYFVIVMNIFALLGFAYAAVTALSVAACGLIVYLLTFLIIGQNKQKLSAHDFGEFTLNAGGAEKLIIKTGEYLVKIKQLNDYIADKSVSDELYEIEKSILKIQNQLKEETIGDRRITQLEEFFEYYMPIIVKILNSYMRIESNELTGKNAVETKNQISEILPLIRKAFEKELDSMLTDEMLDIATDIKVLESMLSNDGLIDKNNIV